jgi:hypothetical protein
MFTLIYIDHDSSCDHYELGCRCFDDPDVMGNWIREYYDGTDFEEKPPIRIFQGELAPLKCKWSMILEPGDPPAKTRGRKGGG